MEPGILEGYRKFLSGGCCDTPIELLKLAGVDMSHTGQWRKHLNSLKSC